MVRVFVVTQHLVGCKLRELRTPRGLSVSSPTISRDHRMNPEAPALLLSSLQFRFVSMERIAFSSLSRCRSLSLSCSFPSRSIGACKDCTVAVLVNSIIPSCGGRSRICRYRNYRGFFVLPCRGKPTCTENSGAHVALVPVMFGRFPQRPRTQVGGNATTACFVSV